MGNTWQSSANVMPTDERTANINRYRALGAEIIIQAADDYVMALRKGEKMEAQTLEKFFRSSWFEMLSGGNIDPEYIIRELRYKAKHRKRVHRNGRRD